MPFESNPTGRSHTCPECGATLGPDQSCRDLFEHMLMLEAEVPGGPGGLPHFYAVGTYQLQHPTSLRAEAAIQLWATVEEALAGKVQIPDILARMRRRFGGATTVRPKDGETSDTLGTWPQSWQMTVADICATDPRYYIEMVERWASTTVATIREGRRS